MSGSSATGHCSSVSSTGVSSTCTDPTSNVLFDGVIPTLTGLDSDMWASQLLTLQRAASKRATVIFDFTDTAGYVGLSGRLEVVMFNCPEKGISASTIRVSTSSSPSVNTTPLMDVNIGITSCDSLVRVCTPITTVQPSITLEFASSDMMYLAEVTFYAANSVSTCPPDTIITTAPPDTITTTAPPDTIITAAPPETIITTAPPVPATTALETHQTETNTTSNCSPENASPTTANIAIQEQVILASVITAIVTALLATVIFMLIQIAVCKCHPNFTLEGAETGTSAGGEGQVYEQVDGGVRGVAVSDLEHTYMEVGAGGGGGNTFQLKENEAYAMI